MPDVVVGRVHERVRISELLGRAADQRPAVVLLVGEAGVGKTTLLRETVRLAEEAGFAAAQGAAVPGASGLAFAPVRTALRALPEAYGTERLDDVIARNPGVEALLTATTPGAHDPRQHPETGELYVRLLDVISELTDERPLLLALEDLHWADRSTLEILSFLVRNLTGERLAVVATMRSDDPQIDPYNVQSIAELARLQGVERLELTRFGRHELRALAVSVLGAAPAPDLLERLWRRSEGNAFFAVELLAATPDHELPPSVRAVVDLRLGLLPDRHRQHVRAAALVGPVIDPGLVASYLERPIEEIEAAMRAALDADILVVDPVDGTLRFRHALLREHAYGELLAGERRRLHDRLATVLSQDPATAPAVLAYHLERAHRMDDAMVATLAAARDAAGDHGTVDAVHHYHRFVELWDEAHDARAGIGCSLVDVLEEAVECAMNAWGSTVTSDLVERLLAEIDPGTDAERWVVHATKLNEVYWEMGRAADAASLLDRAGRLLPDDAVVPAAVRLHERRSYTALLTGDYATAASAAAAAVRCADRIGDAELQAVALGRLGLVHSSEGRLEGLRELRESLELGRALGPGHEPARAAVNMLLILHSAGDVEAAAEAAAEVLGDLDRIAVGPVDRAMLEFLAARIDTARGAFGAAGDRLAASITPEAQRYREYRVIADAELAVATGDLARARTLLEGVELSDVLLPAIQRATVEAELALRSGRSEEAVRVADTYLPLALLVPEVSVLRLCAQALEATPSGDPIADGYLELAEKKWAELSEHDLISQPHLDGLLGDVQNLHAVVWSRPADEVGALAAACFDTAGQRLRAGWARLHHARAVIEAGGPGSDVAAELSRAHAWASDAGATPLRTAVEDLTRRARIDIPGVERLARDDLGLTGRETEVLRLVAAGRTNRQIADELFISPKTASVHVSNILRKVGASNRGEAAAVAHRHGIDVRV